MMSSVVNDPGGRKRISFKCAGKRRSFRLGVCSEREAADIADKIDRLIRLSHQPNLIGSDALAW
ncbi:MAG: hypothetical protein FWD61_18955, partial [Phycisphaerales bacterium]|nr:hypothetical protein [Phycisphaerales bacterium]